MDIYQLNRTYIFNQLKIKKAKYRRWVQKYAQTIEPDLARIVAAIWVIETWHRNCVWRFGEYSYFLVNILLHTIFRVPIRNISIGKFQMKIASLLRLQGVEFRTCGRVLILSRRLTLMRILILLRNVDELESVSRIIVELLDENPPIVETSFWQEKIAINYAGYLALADARYYYLALKHLTDFSSLTWQPRLALDCGSRGCSHLQKT